MHVLRTLNHVTETVRLPTEPWILFDTSLKDATADLNAAALTQPVPHDIVRWAYQMLARFFALEGDWPLTCAALLAGAGTSFADIDPDSRRAKAARACTLIWDYFTLSHEFVHLAFAEGRLAETANAHDAAVTAAFVSSDPTAHMLKAAHSLITFDVADALGRSHGTHAADAVLPNSNAGKLDSLLHGLGTHTFNRERPPQLKEELLCDALATDLTIGAFREAFDAPLLLLAMYLGFRNLQCVEFLRAFAETLAAAHRGRRDNESEARADIVKAEGARALWNSGWRLSAWRNWLPSSLLQMPSAEMHDILRRVSRDYDRSVGDPIVLAQPQRFYDWLTELSELGTLPLTGDLVALMVLGECDTETLATIIERSGFTDDHSAMSLLGALHERDQPRLHAAQMEAIRRTLGVGEDGPKDEPAPSGAGNSGRATVEDLARMFDDGVFKGATHMIIVCDSFDDTDFPEYVMPGQDVHRVEVEAAQKPYQRVMEVYNLREDKLAQMRPGTRVFRY